MESIWTEGVEMPHFQTLEGEIKTDVLIIGGGIAGLLCAYFLQESGVDYILVEGRTICSGITKNTTAKITAQHGLIYHKLLNSKGKEWAQLYLKANQDAVKKYARLCKYIDCDFKFKTSYVYTRNDRKKLEQEIQALEQLGLHKQIVEASELPFPVAGAVAFEEQAQFRPLLFLSRIARDLRIYEHTFVKEFKDNLAVTEKGSIRFDKAVFATHFPIDNKHGMYFLKLYQHRSYVLALKNAPNLNGMYVDDEKTGMSFRNYKDLLFVGGGDHRTGKTGGNWQELRAFARKYYPQAAEAGFWATQDCMSLDGIPYIGQYAKGLPNCYVATGFNKWGMTSSMVAAMLLSDMIREKENPCQELFDPSRSMIKPQLMLNVCEAVKNLLTVTGKRCPHMGCALKWNETEHTWDCPCHGSRFDEKGELIDNPANGDLKKI
ncbi:FAD-dependent oxidoreductase [Faecalicatena contorta]|uniref:FAD-dependent oxidoreductase n=1 Tax=Faecalicatena contorta TaxID=39482 RepID=UPI001F3CAF05|nr:FAD-dependent oxidoreductase [Faecalicatena contorta]MCF2679816.1 FAD-dependent oxidoreductase [Faecalicatena contorta]